jgi:mRNA-degrading endonuclease RelE of RelBE toxin-antitoxin system
MTIKFSERAKKDFAKLPKRLQKKIRQALNDCRGSNERLDIKKIRSTNSLYRIAVETWRIFIYRESDDLRYITSIEQRKDA